MERGSMVDTDGEGPQTAGESDAEPGALDAAPTAESGPPGESGEARPAADATPTDYWSRHTGPAPAPPEPAPAFPSASFGAPGPPNTPGGSSPDAPPPPAATPQPHRSATRTFALALAAVALLLVGTGVVVYAANGDGTNPTNALETAVANLHRAKTAEIALTLSVGANGQGLKMTGNGVTNVLTNATNETLIYNLGGTSFSARAIIDGPTAYFNYGARVGRLVPGKSWVSIDVGQSGASGSQSTGIYSDPTAMVAVLGSRDTVVRALGASDVNGIAVQGYSIDLGPAGIAHLLRSTYFPPDAKRALASSHFSRLDYTAFIDASNRLRDVRTVSNYSVEGLQFTAQGDMSLSDFGVHVTITDPPASQVIPFQQFEKIAAQSQGTATS
jgi:hypothetical protein